MSYFVNWQENGVMQFTGVGGVRLFQWELRGQDWRASTFSDFTAPVLFEALWKQSWLPDSDVSLHLGCCQWDRKSLEQDAHQPHCLGWGVQARAAKISSWCSAEFCPLETDLHLVNMSLMVSQFRLELWSQRWGASISSTKPFSLFLWRKIDF